MTDSTPAPSGLGAIMDGAPPALSIEQAYVKYGELRRDADFQQKLAQNNPEAHREMREVREGLLQFPLDTESGVQAQAEARAMLERVREVDALGKIYSFDDAVRQELIERKPITADLQRQAERTMARMNNDGAFMQKVHAGAQPEKSQYGAAMLLSRCFPVAR